MLDPKTESTVDGRLPGGDERLWRAAVGGDGLCSQEFGCRLQEAVHGEPARDV